MSPVTPQSIENQLRWRYATKAFDPNRKISDEHWETLVSALVLTPSSYGLQPWKFFVVANPEMKEQLVAHSWGQRQVADASHTVVMAIRNVVDEAYIDHYLERIAAVRGGSVESLAGFRKMMVGSLISSKMDLRHWAEKQVYIALGNLMTAAALLGIDTCPMEGIQPAKYDEILQLPAEGYSTSVVCTLGYRADSDKYAAVPKVRFPVEEMVTEIH